MRTNRKTNEFRKALIKKIDATAKEIEAATFDGKDGPVTNWEFYAIRTGMLSALGIVSAVFLDEGEHSSDHENFGLEASPLLTAATCFDAAIHMFAEKKTNGLKKESGKE